MFVFNHEATDDKPTQKTNSKQQQQRVLVVSKGSNNKTRGDDRFPNPSTNQSAHNLTTVTIILLRKPLATTILYLY